MDKNWVCVYKTTKLFDAEAVKGNLEHAGITAVIMNRQDSSYLSFGYVEIHVQQDQREKALELINDINKD